MKLERMCYFLNISSFFTPSILLERKPLALLKKKKFQPVISNTCPRYLTKHNTTKLCLFRFPLRSSFFPKDVALVTCVQKVVDVYSACFNA